MTRAALFEALAAERGLVCAIGAGGKKSTLYALLERHPGRAAMTASVYTYEPPRGLRASVLVKEENQLRQTIDPDTAAPLLYACPADKPGRLAGPSPGTIHDLHRQGAFDLTLIKADGARMRRIKVPGEHEPFIPDFADTVLVVSSLLAIGEPLTDRVAHRLPRVLEVTGQTEGSPVTAATLSALYTHPSGLQRGTGGHRLIAVLNMADGPEQWAQGREVARHILAESDRYDRVVLLSNRKPDLLVDVISP